MSDLDDLIDDIFTKLNNTKELSNIRKFIKNFKWAEYSDVDRRKTKADILLALSHKEAVQLLNAINVPDEIRDRLRTEIDNFTSNL